MARTRRVVLDNVVVVDGSQYGTDAQGRICDADGDPLDRGAYIIDEVRRAMALRDLQDK